MHVICGSYLKILINCVLETVTIASFRIPGDWHIFSFFNKNILKNDKKVLHFDKWYVKLRFVV